MGVHGLWQLLEGAGQPVTLESLEGKVLAVDVSIWLHQTMKGMRDKNGNPLPNAHLQGLFSRVCKLLFYRIRPIFVFDGGVPLLKKQTLAARRERKEAAHRESGKTSQKLLQNMIRRQVLQVALGQSIDSFLPLPAPTTRGPDMFELAPIPEGSRVLDEDSDPEDMRGSNPYLPFLEEADNYLGDVDTESADFRSLPHEIQHEFLSELKEVRKRDILRRAQELPENSGDFSNFQIRKLLKQSRLTNQIETVRKEMNAKTSGAIIKNVSGKEDYFNHSVESGRIISEDSAHFILIKGLSKARQLDRGRELAEETKGHMSNAAKEVAAITAKASSASAGERSTDLDHFAGEPAPSGSRAADLEESDGEVVPSMSGAKQGERSRFAGKKVRFSANHSSTRGSKRVPGQEQHVTLSSSDSEDSSMHGVTETVTVTRSQARRGAKRPIVIDSDNDDSDVKLARHAEAIQDNTVGSSGSSLSKCETAAAAPRSGSSRSAVPAHELAVTSSTSDDKQDALEGVRGKAVVEPLLPKGREPQSSSEEEAQSSGTVADRKILEFSFDPVRVKEDDVFPLEMFEQATSSPTLRSATRHQPKTGTVFPVAHSSPQTLAAMTASVEEIEEDEDDEDVKMVEDKSKTVEAMKEAKDESESVSDAEMMGDEGRETPEPPKAVTLSSEEEEQESEAPEPDSEEEKFAAKYQGASASGLVELQEELAQEEQTLRSEQGRQQRLATSITDQVNLEAQELLKLFGVPFVVSATEAESQCAFLDMAQLTHGTITDDSDVWLFGGQRVYKNFFNVNKHVELFTFDRVQSMYGLSRDHLINLALLCGSDYTEGIPSVGPVRALEIMAEFPGEKQEGLVAFRNWWKAAQDQLHMMPENKIREKLRDLEVKLGFPNMAVVEAYLRPTVDDSEEPFSWGIPDLELLRDFATAKFGWDTEKADEVLIPVMQELNKKQHQPRISAFFQPELQAVKKKTFTSKRMQQALTRVVEGPSTSPPLPESNADRIRKAKEILRATNPRGRGRGRGRSGGSKFKARREVNLSESSSSGSDSGSSSDESEEGSEESEDSQSESDSEEDAPPAVKKGRVMNKTVPVTLNKSNSQGHAAAAMKKGQMPKESVPSTSGSNSKQQNKPAPQKGKKTAAKVSKKKEKPDSDWGSEILKKNAERIAMARRVMLMRRKAQPTVKVEKGTGQAMGGNSVRPGQGGDHGINLEDYEDLGSSFSEED